MKTFRVRKTSRSHYDTQQLYKGISDRFIYYYMIGVIGNEQALFSRLCREAKKIKSVK